MIKKEKKLIPKENQYNILSLYSLLLIIVGLFIGPPLELIKQVWTLVISKCFLFTDYFAISSIETAFINSGLITLIVISIARINRAEINGFLIASFFIVSGFSLFGKNLYNITSIILGVYLYSKFKKESFSKYVAIANFATSLAPLVSQVTFGMNLQPVIAIILANFIGLIIGFIFPILESSFASFHKGFNIYNAGFTSGVIGVIFMSLFRLIGYDHSIVRQLTTKSDIRVVIFIYIYFFSMIVVGCLSGKKTIKDYVKILKYSGEPGTDFVVSEGFDLAIINMGVMGISMTTLALLFEGPLNGLVVGAILTVVGFSALSKHLFNTLPIIIGVVFAYLLAGRSMSDTVCMINALFSTTLAPIAGCYGIPAGILAGFLHGSLVGNLLGLHGGMNLYNNGFSGGFIAALLVPLLDKIKKKK